MAHARAAATGKGTAVRAILVLLAVYLPPVLALSSAKPLGPPLPSHSRAAEQALGALHTGDLLTPPALLGSLEARIYRCECGSGIHLWDVAGGLRLWASAHGLQVTTRAAVLRGEPGDPQKPNAAGQATSRLELDDLRRALAAGEG